MQTNISKLLQKKSGFTLIELLVVVAIIGVLTAVLLVNLVGIRERGADTSKKSDLNQLKTSLRLYYNDAQTYPAANSGNIVACNGGACSEGEQMTDAAGNTVYMKSVPEYSTYAQTNSGEGFLVGVELANTSDPDIAGSAAKCGVSSPTAGYFYVCSD